MVPVTMEFDRSNWNVEQSAIVSFTDAGAMVKGSREVSLSLGVYGQSSSDGYFQGSAAQTVAVQIENANAAPAFDLAAIGAIELTLDENSGQLRQASATDVGTPITATNEDNDNASLTYTLVGAGSQFRIGASDGQLAAAAGVNFNHERQSSYELTVQAADGETAAPGLVPGIARVKVTVLLNDVAEKPNDYTGHGFVVSGRTRNALTLGWSNAEYEAQFAEFDRFDSGKLRRRRLCRQAGAVSGCDAGASSGAGSGGGVCDYPALVQRRRPGAGYGGCAKFGDGSGQ